MNELELAHQMWIEADKSEKRMYELLGERIDLYRSAVVMAAFALKRWRGLEQEAKE